MRGIVIDLEVRRPILAHSADANMGKTAARMIEIV
jgi:hypothetical protein